MLAVIDSLPAKTNRRGSMVFLRNRSWRAIAASLAILLFSGIAYALVTEVIIPAIRSDQPATLEQPVDGKPPSGVSSLNSDEPQVTSQKSDSENHTGSSDNMRAPGTAPAGGNASSLHRDPLVNLHGNSSMGNRLPLSPLQTATSDAGEGSPGSNFAIAPEKNAGSAVVATSFNDTAVCRGEKITYRAVEDPKKHTFAWYLNGQEFIRLRGPEIQINTARLNYGTQRLSLVIKSATSRQVVRVVNSAIIVLEAPSLSVKTALCGYEQVTLSAGSDNPNWEYIWSNGSRNPATTVSQTGNYALTVRIKGGNCSVTDTFNVKVLSKPSINIPREQSVCAGQSLLLEVKNPQNDHLVVWSPGKVNSNKYSFHGENPGRYAVQVTVTGCKTETHELVIRVDDCRLTIPNFFTPNGDGINDLFVVKGAEYYKGSRLVVTDRNGRTVYESNDYQNDWNGENLPDGTYFYLFYPGGDEQSARSGMVAVRR